MLNGLLMSRQNIRGAKIQMKLGHWNHCYVILERQDLILLFPILALG